MSNRISQQSALAESSTIFYIITNCEVSQKRNNNVTNMSQFLVYNSRRKAYNIYMQNRFAKPKKPLNTEVASLQIFMNTDPATGKIRFDHRVFEKFPNPKAYEAHVKEERRKERASKTYIKELSIIEEHTIDPRYPTRALWDNLIHIIIRLYNDRVSGFETDIYNLAHKIHNRKV